MSKIFKRESLRTKSRKLKVDKNRKRNIIVNFRMSPEEKSLLIAKNMVAVGVTDEILVQLTYYSIGRASCRERV